jgi:hypothetical protein
MTLTFFVLHILPLNPSPLESAVRWDAGFICGGLLGGLLSVPITKWIYKTTWKVPAMIWAFFWVVQIIILDVIWSTSFKETIFYIFGKYPN